MNKLKKSVAVLVAASLLAAGLPAGTAQAGIVGTEQVQSAGTPAATSARERVDALLARQDVQAALEKNGVSTGEARARVEALSDDELDQLAANLDQLPAGSGILGLVFVTFIVLLVTDILGFTKVFPFTRSVK